MDQTSFCTLMDQKSLSRFLCYTSNTNGTFRICLTDAADVWSTEYTEDSLIQFRQRFALQSTEDYVLKLRSACGSGDLSVVVQESSVELHVGSGSGVPSVTLSRLESLEATTELRALLFRMADCLSQPDTTHGSTSSSPVKNHHRRHADFEPRQQQRCHASVTVKKRPVGTSLINPGTKKKMRATGVAFDDADED